MKKAYLVSTAILALSACGVQPSSVSLTSHYTEAKNQWAPQNGSIRLAVLGDSLAAGLLANTYTGQPFSSERILSFMGAVATLSTNTERGPIGNAKEMDRLFAKPELGALTGIQEYSLATHLTSKYPNSKMEDVRRYAISSTRTSNLSVQIQAMKTDYQTYNKQQADIVVMHVGSNDWCDMRPSSEFEYDLRARVKEVMELNPQARILVLPISDLVSVLSVADKQSTSSTLFGADTMQCKQIKETAKTCMKRGIQMGASAADVAVHRQSLYEYNQIISNVVESVPNEVPTFIGKVSTGTNFSKQVNFQWDWLAIDCFHPGAKGQKVIGDLVWQDLNTLLDK